MSHFLVFGSHPALSLAELKAVRQLKSPLIICGEAALVDDSGWQGDVLMNQLGGTVKLGDIVKELTAEELLDRGAKELAYIIEQHRRDERVVFGYTVYGGATGMRRRLEKLPLQFKRELKTHGFSARWVTQKKSRPLTPAAVAKLKLTTDGYDFAILIHGSQTAVGLTTEVQDADAWSLRDYGRPMRDELKGMLPPKLARIMVNLAQVPKDGVVVDPFCGSGTILMEALLGTQAKKIIGSDIDPSQIQATQKNNDWLLAQRIVRPEDKERVKLFAADVKQIGKHLQPESIDAVVTEGDLGPPLKGHEPMNQLKKTAEKIRTLWCETLKALHPLLKKGGRVVGIWPTFLSSHGQVVVSLLKDPETIKHYRLLGEPLQYQRPGQRVIRKIVILEKL